MRRRLCLLVGLAFVTFGAGARGDEPAGLTVYLADRGDPLTHAVVKKVLADGILFVSDQGLVKARFDQLPPDWRASYELDSRRVANRDRQIKKETAEILKARASAAKVSEKRILTGSVLSRANGFLTVNCEQERADWRGPPVVSSLQRIGGGGNVAGQGAEPPKEEYPRMIGWAVIRDSNLYQTVSIGQRIRIVGRKVGEISLENGQEVPCFEVVKP